MALNFVLLWLVTRMSKPPVSERKVSLALCVTLLAESILFAVIALSKLALYIDCFGFTPLRLQSTWLALVLLLLFTVQLPIFPIGFSVPVGMAADEVSLADRLYHAFLPACTLGLTGISSIAMHTREKVIEILESDYVLYARARGESGWRLIFRHGLRNLLLPVITLQFGSISEIFGGSVLVEQVFSYPGLGQAAVTAGLGSDIPLLLGITLISAVLVFAGNAAADGLYRLVDPRLRKGGRA